MTKHAVILLNMGGPDSLDSVEPFLFNLFSDHDIFPFPFAQKQLARFISRRRAPKVRGRYQLIGGNSPINRWTEVQRSMLEETLRKHGHDITVYTAMRYWRPMIRTVADSVAALPYERIVLLPLYPHYSVTTTGSAFHEWKRSYKGNSGRLIYVNDYFDHAIYADAVCERINEALCRFSENTRTQVRFLFSAHGTPERLEKKGDPYHGQIKKTVSLIMKQGHFSNPHHLCFQSRVGPVRWLGPSTIDTIRTLAAQGEKNILIIPISFVSDHIETLYELDMEYRRFAEEAGIKNFEVMKGLNDSATFVDALRDISLKALLSKGSG